VRDFEQERRHYNEDDLVFAIRGVTLRMRPAVAPEVVAAFEDDAVRVDATSMSQLAAFDTLIQGMLMHDSAEAWAKLRANTDDPITMREMETIAYHLIQVMAGHPTDAPSVSSNGGAQTDPSSREASSSQEATPVA
jgi:hypothetical protein